MLVYECNFGGAGNDTQSPSPRDGPFEKRFSALEGQLYRDSFGWRSSAYEATKQGCCPSLVNLGQRIIRPSEPTTDPGARTACTRVFSLSQKINKFYK